MASDEGLFGTFGTRLKVAMTSSAVKSEPSWNLTPFLSLNSQVVSSIGFQLSARPGLSVCFSSCFTSGSKKCFDMPLFGDRLWKCGSREVIGVDSAIDNSCAAADSEVTASAATKAFLKIIGAPIIDSNISSPPIIFELEPLNLPTGDVTGLRGVDLGVRDVAAQTRF